MRKNKLLALLLAGTMVAGAAVAFTGCDNSDDPNKPGGKGEAITVWVSETEGVKTLTDTQVAKFIEDNGYTGKFNVTVQGISEGEAATQMVTDVASGADVFCFAQDQMARLIEAKALSKLGTTSAQFVQDNNDAGAVRASTVNGDVYSYPITSDNGYFMYYDKSVIKETSVNDLASIVADCKAANKLFTFPLGQSAWYNASFFFGAGCTSSWQYDDDTKHWIAADNFGDEEKGLIALKGMQILTNEQSVHNDVETGASEFGAATPSAVVISGTWDAAKAEEILGENLGVAKLPTYKVDGKTYQLGSFSGYKLMGVKPQTSTERTEFCHKLAQYLSGEECQQARLEQFSWGPSNKVAAASETAQSNLALKGLAAQAPYSTPQGQIHGGWWDLAKGLGVNAGLDDKGLKGLLKTYRDGIARFESMTEEAMAAYGVIGKIASLAGTTENLSEGQTGPWDGKNGWNVDYKMVKTEKDDVITWKTVAKITLAAGDQFQVRQGQAWTVQYGAVGDDGYSTKNNFEITAENAGTKYIVLTLTKVGEVEKGVVSLSDE